jgi:hypothetical protein
MGRLDCWENPQVIVGGALKLILRQQIVGIAIYGISDNCSSHQIKPASANPFSKQVIIIVPVT